MDGDQQLGLFSMVIIFIIFILSITWIYENRGYVNGYKAGYSNAKSGDCDHAYFKTCSDK